MTNSITALGVRVTKATIDDTRWFTGPVEAASYATKCAGLNLNVQKLAAANEALTEGERSAIRSASPYVGYSVTVAMAQRLHWLGLISHPGRWARLTDRGLAAQVELIVGGLR